METPSWSTAEMGKWIDFTSKWTKSETSKTKSSQYINWTIQCIEYTARLWRKTSSRQALGKACFDLNDSGLFGWNKSVLDRLSHGRLRQGLDIFGGFRIRNIQFNESYKQAHQTRPQVFPFKFSPSLFLGKKHKSSAHQRFSTKLFIKLFNTFPAKLHSLTIRYSLTFRL